MADPTTPAGIAEVDRMQRAHAMGDGIWSATRWLLTLLGGGAFFTIGLRIQNPGHNFLWSPVWALAAILVAALAFVLITVITTSRMRKADEAALHRRGTYILLAALFVFQVVAIAAAPVLQGVAVYQTLQATDSRTQADDALRQRLQAYSADPSGLRLVVAYCKQHQVDDQVSDRFLTICLAFLQGSPPTPGQAATLARSLS